MAPTPTQQQPQAQAQDDGSQQSPAEAVSHVANVGSRASDGTQSAALQWFLKTEQDAGESYEKTLDLNFGTAAAPEWVPWTIKPIDEKTMKQIRRASSARAERSRNGMDPEEDKVNLQIIINATVDPDIREAAKLMGIADPAEALRIRLAKKPGFITQLAGEIGSLSGFDAADVRDTVALEAGKG